MGLAGRERIIERCSLESVTAATLEAYREDARPALPAPAPRLRVAR
jgi:hypothetical protein